jgi:lysophospholipase L1-like esterase
VFLRGRVRIAAAAAATAAAAAVTGLVLVLASSATPPAQATPPARAIAAATNSPTAVVQDARPPSVSACVQELGHDRGAHLLVVVGASFTAGVGPGNPDKSWAVVLARTLHWNAVVYGVPGAGYVRLGAGRRGPVTAELARIDLSALDPDLIIVQAGHDDIGVNPGLEERRVADTIALIRAEAPGARIALVTVFPGRAARAAAWRTDRAIVTGATAADPDVIIMDPLAARWDYQRSADGLHPTVAGSDWLAGQIAGLLRGHGVRAATASASAKPVLCDYSSAEKHTPAGKHSRILVPPPDGASTRIDPP